MVWKKRFKKKAIIDDIKVFFFPFIPEILHQIEKGSPGAETGKAGSQDPGHHHRCVRRVLAPILLRGPRDGREALLAAAPGRLLALFVAGIPQLNSKPRHLHDVLARLQEGLRQDGAGEQEEEEPFHHCGRDHQNPMRLFRRYCLLMRCYLTMFEKSKIRYSIEYWNRCALDISIDLL